MCATRLYTLLCPSVQPTRHQISPPGLKSALRASNQHSRPQISSQGFKSALQASNLLSRPRISVPDLKSALQATNLPLMPQAYPQTSNLIFRPKICPSDLKSPPGRLEITPCVLQDIGPWGLLLCSHSTTSLDHSKQGTPSLSLIHI